MLLRLIPRNIREKLYLINLKTTDIHTVIMLYFMIGEMQALMQILIYKWPLIQM